ncbi:hypothetical protein GCM10009579_57220 [Streptomyces javensis]|uniref:Uncharacterized protein n=1 Tax=Streptomyces javensis TaxID=114698 RepID=A0ABN1X918_9ACTN
MSSAALADPVGRTARESPVPTAAVMAPDREMNLIAYAFLSSGVKQRITAPATMLADRDGRMTFHF